MDGRASWPEALDLLKKISTENTRFYAPHPVDGKSLLNTGFGIIDEFSCITAGALAGFATVTKAEAYLRGLSDLNPALNMEDGGDA